MKIVYAAVMCGLVILVGCVPAGKPRAGTGAHTQAAVRANRSHALRAEDFSSEYLSGATLVYFSKPSCPACAKQDPKFEELMNDLPSGGRAIKVYPYMVDLDYYGVDELPTLVVYKNGKPGKRFIGVTSTGRLRSALADAAE